MRTLPRNGDFWAGLALAALGAYIVLEARAWPYQGEDGPGPGFFPMWYGSIMVALSLFLVGRAVIAPAAVSAKVEWRDLGRAFTCWGAFVACIALMKLIGFAAAFALLTWFVIAVMARRPQRVAVPIALAGAALFHVIFVMLLEVSVPQGLWF